MSKGHNNTGNPEQGAIGMATKEVKVCDLCGAVEKTGQEFELLTLGEESSEICPKCAAKVLSKVNSIAHPTPRKPRAAK
jgi:hypothetical protein